MCVKTEIKAVASICPQGPGAHPTPSLVPNAAESVPQFRLVHLRHLVREEGADAPRPAAAHCRAINVLEVSRGAGQAVAGVGFHLPRPQGPGAHPTPSSMVEGLVTCCLDIASLSRSLFLARSKNVMSFKKV